MPGATQRRWPLKGDEETSQRPPHERGEEKKGPLQIEGVHHEVNGDEPEQQTKEAVWNGHPGFSILLCNDGLP